MDGRPRDGAERSVSEVVGVVVLFGIVMAGLGLLLVTGGQLTDDISSTTQMSAAEGDMQNFERKLGSTAGGDDATDITLGGRGEGSVTMETGGTLAVRINGNSACSASVPLDEVHYRVGNTGTLVYQGGAVWKQTDAGTSMVSPPAVRYQNGTLDLSLVTLQGEAGHEVNLEREAATSHQRTEQARAALFSQTSCRRPDSVEIAVTTGRFDEQWLEYFRSEMPPGATVTYDEPNDRVTVTLHQDQLIERADDERNHVVDFRFDNQLGEVGDVDGDSYPELTVDKPDDSNEYPASATVLGSFVAHHETETVNVPIYGTQTVTQHTYSTTQIPMKLWIDPNDSGNPHPITNEWHYVRKYDQPLEGFEPPVYVVLFADNVHSAASWSSPPPNPTSVGKQAYKIKDVPGSKYDKIIPQMESAPEPTNDDIMVYKAGCDVSHLKFIGKSAAYHNEFLIGDSPSQVVIADDENVHPGQVIDIPGGDKCTSGSQFYYQKQNYEGVQTTTQTVVTGYNSVTRHRIVNDPAVVTMSTPSIGTRSLVAGGSPVDRAINYEQAGTGGDSIQSGVEVPDGDPVNLDAKFYGCTQSQETTVTTVSNGGVNYNVTRCTGTTGTPADPSTVEVYTDGDPIPSSSAPWYQRSVEDVVAPQYTDGSGNFDLDSNQVVVLFEYDDDGDGTGEHNNVVVLFELGNAVSEVSADFVVDLKIDAVSVEEE